MNAVARKPPFHKTDRSGREAGAVDPHLKIAAAVGHAGRRNRREIVGIGLSAPVIAKLSGGRGRYEIGGGDGDARRADVDEIVRA